MNKKLFLIDGHALIFKMYYAFLRHPMINSKGADMSILFGFTKYILELIEKEKPTHLAVAFDPPGGSNAIARCVGFSFSMSSSMYLVNPNRMDMSAPLELIIGCRRNA